MTTTHTTAHTGARNASTLYADIMRAAVHAPGTTGARGDVIKARDALAKQREIYTGAPVWSSEAYTWQATAAQDEALAELLTMAATEPHHVKFKTASGSLKLRNVRERLEQFASDMLKGSAWALWGGGPKPAATAKPRKAPAFKAGSVRLVGEMLSEGQWGDALELAERQAGGRVYMMREDRPFLTWAAEPAEGLPAGFVVGKVHTEGATHWETWWQATGHTISASKLRKSSRAAALNCALLRWSDWTEQAREKTLKSADEFQAPGTPAQARAAWIAQHCPELEQITPPDTTAEAEAEAKPAPDTAKDTHQADAPAAESAPDTEKDAHQGDTPTADTPALHMTQRKERAPRPYAAQVRTFDLRGITWKITVDRFWKHRRLSGATIIEDPDLLTWTAHKKGGRYAAQYFSRVPGDNVPRDVAMRAHKFWQQCQAADAAGADTSHQGDTPAADTPQTAGPVAQIVAQAMAGATIERARQTTAPGAPDTAQQAAHHDTHQEDSHQAQTREPATYEAQAGELVTCEAQAGELVTCATATHARQHTPASQAHTAGATVGAITGDATRHATQRSAPHHAPGSAPGHAAGSAPGGTPGHNTPPRQRIAGKSGSWSAEFWTSGGASMLKFSHGDRETLQACNTAAERMKILQALGRQADQAGPPAEPGAQAGGMPKGDPATPSNPGGMQSPAHQPCQQIAAVPSAADKVPQDLAQNQKPDPEKSEDDRAALQTAATSRKYPQSQGAPGFELAKPANINLLKLVQHGMTLADLVGLGVQYRGDMANPEGEGAIVQALPCPWYGLNITLGLEDGRQIKVGAADFECARYAINWKRHGAPYLAQLAAAHALKAAEKSAIKQAQQTAYAAELESIKREYAYLQQDDGKHGGGGVCCKKYTHHAQARI